MTQKENKLWIVVFSALFFIYAYLHISTGYLYTKDVGMWFFHSANWIMDWDYTRAFAHFLNGAPAQLVSFFNQDIRVLANVYLAAPWLWLAAAMALSYQFLTDRYRHLIWIFPLFWSMSLMRGFVFSEVIYSSIIILMFNLFLIQNIKKINLKTEIVIHVFILLIGFTHQSVTLIMPLYLIYFVAESMRRKENCRRFIRLILFCAAMLAFNLYFIIWPTEPVCAACKDDFKVTLLSFRSQWPFYESVALITLMGLSEFKKVWARFGLLLLLSFSVWNFFNFNWSDMYFHWNNRVYMMQTLALLTSLMLVLLFFNLQEKAVAVFSRYTLLACLCFNSMSFYYLLEWRVTAEKFRVHLKENKIQKPIVYLKDTQLFGHRQIYLTEAASVARLSVLLPALAGENKINKIFLTGGNKANEELWFLTALAGQQKVKIELSTALRDCLQQIAETKTTKLDCVD